MFTLKHYDLSDINASDTFLNKLYEIFKTTLNPGLTEREFRYYYFSQHPDNMEFTLIYHADELAGFCSAAAYPRRLNGKKVVIIRSAFGLLNKYKNGRFPLQGLFYKYMRYKFAHPFTPVYVAGFMANPFMYAMICKYTRVCYPRWDRNTPPEVLEFKDSLLESMRMTRKETAPFVLKIHFQVHFTPEELERFNTSQDKDVKHFLSINPSFTEQMGVLVLVPVTFSNMLYTMGRHMYRSLIKKRQSKKQL